MKRLHLLSLILIGAFALGGCSDSVTEPDTDASLSLQTAAERAGPPQLGKKALYQERLEVGRALLEVQFSNVAEVLPYYTDDIEYHDPIVDIYGIDQMTGFLNQLLGAGDLLTVVEDETLIGDTYSATWTMSGDFVGVPYEAKGISIFKFRRKTSMVYY